MHDSIKYDIYIDIAVLSSHFLTFLNFQFYVTPTINSISQLIFKIVFISYEVLQYCYEYFLHIYIYIYTYTEQKYIDILCMVENLREIYFPSMVQLMHSYDIYWNWNIITNLWLQLTYWIVSYEWAVSFIHGNVENW